MSLAKILNCSRLTSIVDVGASPIDSEPPYKRMLEQRLCTVVGFEPNPQALAQLNAAKSDLETYFPDAIGFPGIQKAYLCNAPGMNSLLEPDPDALKCFTAFCDWGRVEETVHCKMIALADVLSCDLLKIDIQGGELNAFRSGQHVMNNLVAVHTEVSFVPIYKGQPTFGEIDLELRGHGLVPHTFVDIKKWPIAPASGPVPHPRNHQLLEADIVYVRDFTKMDAMSDEQLKHLAMISHYCYGSTDLVIRCLTWLAKRGAVAQGSAGNYLAHHGDWLGGNAAPRRSL